ncbi:MAG: hypothetical protein U1D30_20780 [Planctomycetota bacterium]
MAADVGGEYLQKPHQRKRPALNMRMSRICRGVVLLGVLGLFRGTLRAQEPSVEPPVHSTPEKQVPREAPKDSAEPAKETVGPLLTLDQLACMSECELEALYRQGKAETIPCGFLRGKVLYGCSKWSGVKGTVSGAAWKGKHFHAEDGLMVNQWLGLKAVKASVFLGESWMDGGPAIITDYQGMSPVIWRNVRDEIREVSPGLYLGVMYVRKCPEAERRTFFALSAFAIVVPNCLLRNCDDAVRPQSIGCYQVLQPQYPVDRLHAMELFNRLLILLR